MYYMHASCLCKPVGRLGTVPKTRMLSRSEWITFSTLDAWCKALDIRWSLDVGFSIGLAFMFRSALMPLDVGDIVVLYICLPCIEWLCIPDTITGVLIELFLICSNILYSSNWAHYGVCLSFGNASSCGPQLWGPIALCTSYHYRSFDSCAWMVGIAEFAPSVGWTGHWH